jgi:hypothetical protein
MSAPSSGKPTPATYEPRDWRSGLFISSLDLFELFLERHPPMPEDRRAWERLERIAWRLHGHAADAGSGSPGARLRSLRDTLRDCHKCVETLRVLTPAPVTLLAFRRLDRIVRLLDDALDDMPPVVIN